MGEKLRVCAKKLEGRYCKKLLEVLQIDGEMSRGERIDFYLEMKVFRESYNNYRD
jgi:hypothetical protein